MKKEVAIVSEEKAVVSTGGPSALIQMAINSGADLEKLKSLLDLQEKWEAIEARKAYNSAMSEFKANPPKIDKDREVSFKTDRGQVNYHHATLGNVTEKINSELSKYGLSAGWLIKQNGSISVTCRITHVKGHSEETTLSAPADNSGSKNTIQAIGSTVTYLSRYTLLSLFGLATFDQDDDGVASSKPIVFMPEPKKSINGPSVPKVEREKNGVRITESTAKSNPGLNSPNKPAKVVDTGDEEPPTGPISEETGKKLLSLAIKNGWTKEDVKEYVHSLGYVNVKELTNWDFPTVFKHFSKTKSEYEETVKE